MKRTTLLSLKIGKIRRCVNNYVSQSSVCIFPFSVCLIYAILNT